ncbi:HAAS signaling domain-containing protein [Solicola gregarius]|uniref:Uncharacterized protein n=1 Tax=Solicola gregarius TaxID=2908642 RepID=A0AA46TJG6_9ACTN|nr:hypothetical protein [Solicola gregarius]UYM06489.1 hypothetical protein L0C25_05290 [Solicola gregarius]
MTTETLTDRYVDAVVRRIPADQRDDVAAELHTTIADTIDARDDDHETAERTVITELGDPIRLAARYTGRPLALIGPALYPTYVRVLTLLLSTVLPLVTAVSVIVEIVDHNDAGSAVEAGLDTIITVGAQMIAWLTVVFAVMDRLQVRGRLPDIWTPDRLPRVRRSDRASTGACASAAWNASLLVLILWQYSAEPYHDGDTRLTILDPELWSGWIWPILAGFAAIVVLEIIRIRRRAWSVPLVAWYAAAQAAVALPLAWLFYDQRLLNPEFVAAVGDDQVAPDSWWSAAAVIVLIIGAVEIAKRFREARR